MFANRIRPVWVFLAPALLVVAPSVWPTPMCCNCDDGGPTRTIATDKMLLPSNAAGRLMRHVEAPRRKSSAQVMLDDPTAFYGDIAGSWDDVDGYFSIPYTLPLLGELNILLRGFAAQPVGGDRYAVAGWDRSVYWIDIGDGTPRLLQALELVSDYVPEPDDYFEDSQVVVDTCTPSAQCTLNLVPYLRYQEFGADYSGERGVSEDGVFFDEIQLAFVTDGEGDAIDAAVLFDDPEIIDTIQPFELGDRILLATLAYKIDEPEYIYALGYMDAFAALTLEAGIERANYIPGVDFADPDLPPDLNAGTRPLRLILDASSGQGGGYGTGGGRPEGGFAYGGPFDLGFRWKDASTFVFGNSFESLTPLGAAAKATKMRASLVRGGSR